MEITEDYKINAECLGLPPQSPVSVNYDDVMTLEEFNSIFWASFN